VAVPRFSYELPPARKDRKVISVVLHLLLIVFLWQVVPLLPSSPATTVRPAESVTLYAPAPEPKTTAPVIKPEPRITVPPKVLAVLNAPRLVAPPVPKVEPPKLEVKPTKFDELVKVQPPKPKLEQKVVTGAFANQETARTVESKKEIVASAFSGSSEPATVRKPAAQVQTGGFGDPNGVHGNSDKRAPVMVASVGSFSLPSGAGNGNGTAGSRGVSGTVASAGFGDVAAGGTSDRTRRGTVAQGGFGQVTTVASTPRPRIDDRPNTKPVEILSKPRPAYTDEARRLRIEGEVLLEVLFGAAGDLQVQRVVRGLGHGLDESAQRAARQIRFKPAQRDGSPFSTIAQVHIIFELAE
jgi:TonB family protein